MKERVSHFVAALTTGLDDSTIFIGSVGELTVCMKGDAFLHVHGKTSNTTDKDCVIVEAYGKGGKAV
jgi:oxalate decarboxylase/phosphoglucose isomerase-like protein (cupin superfamily)